MRDIGFKAKKTPKIMLILAASYKNKGDIDKALTYVNRALSIGNEVLDGVKVHDKYIPLISLKADILLKKK
jgi:hypothetical protein